MLLATLFLWMAMFCFGYSLPLPPVDSDRVEKTWHLLLLGAGSLMMVFAIKHLARMVMAL